MDEHEKKYQRWLKVVIEGKERLDWLVESFCFDGYSHQKMTALWMTTLLKKENSMPTRLMEFDAFCRREYERKK